MVGRTCLSQPSRGTVAVGSASGSSIRPESGRKSSTKFRSSRAVAVEHLALPERAAGRLGELDLLRGDPALEAAEDLLEPRAQVVAAREEEVAEVGAVGDRAGGEAAVELVDLLLAQREEVRRRQAGELGAAEREVVLDPGHVDAEDLGRVVRVVEAVVGQRREGDVRAHRLGRVLGGRQPVAEAGEPDAPEHGDADDGEEDDPDDDAEEAFSIAPASERRQEGDERLLVAPFRPSPKRCPSFSLVLEQVRVVALDEVVADLQGQVLDAADDRLLAAEHELDAAERAGLDQRRADRREAVAQVLALGGGEEGRVLGLELAGIAADEDEVLDACPCSAASSRRPPGSRPGSVSVRPRLAVEELDLRARCR